MQFTPIDCWNRHPQGFTLMCQNTHVIFETELLVSNLNRTAFKYLTEFCTLIASLVGLQVLISSHLHNPSHRIQLGEGCRAGGCSILLHLSLALKTGESEGWVGPMGGGGGG